MRDGFNAGVIKIAKAGAFGGRCGVHLAIATD
jgi:hypothetical protein